MSLNGELSLTDAVLLTVGNVIGAGIFTTSGLPAGEVPDPVLFIGADTTIAVQIAFNNPSASLQQIGIALSGLPFFFWWTVRNGKLTIPGGKAIS